MILGYFWNLFFVSTVELLEKVCPQHSINVNGFQ